jgi:hypothetical protein
MADSIMEIEPNIVKAQFIVQSVRIYNLEFDQNIEMKELKTMIRVAAHLKKNNFRLFSEGQEYTDFNEESFESLFPNQKLVVFHIQKGEGEVFDEAELLLQINSPCPEHSEKFLLFYCFDCGCSICCDCFTIGSHKGHHIQDKCYYLLPSKFLVQKLFESWSRNPYEEYKISTDLTEYKNKLNNVLFAQLFQMLKEIQDKCNNLIDSYNNININSVKNIRDSVREIKVSCIKILDDLKEQLHIKDIVNNPQIFKEFDFAYKELGRVQNERFKKNLDIFKQLNQQVSITVTTLIEKIYNIILETLKKALNDDEYNNVKIQINEKLVKPVDHNDIINFGINDKNSSGLTLTQAIHNGILNVSNNNS